MDIASGRVPASGEKRTRLWLLAVCLFVWLSWLLVIWFSVRLVSSHPYDFEAYYAAAEALRYWHGSEIFSATTLLHVSAQYGNCHPYGNLGYVYPPLLAMMLEPLTLLPCASAAVIWMLVNAALWVVVTFLLWSVIASRWRTARLESLTLASVVSFCFWPMAAGLFLGQAHILVLASMMVAIWLAEREHDWLAGAALAFGVMIKFFPVVIILYFLVRGRYRVVGGAIIAGIVLILVMAWASSPLLVAQSIAAALDNVRGDMIPGGANESLFISIPTLGPALALLVMITSAALVVVRRGDQLLGVGLVVCAMLLGSPLVWSFLLAWIIPALCACFAYLGPLTSGRWRKRGIWLVVLALYVVLAIPQWQLPHPLATLALWGLLGVLYWRSGDAAGIAAGKRMIERLLAATPRGVH